MMKIQILFDKCICYAQRPMVLFQKQGGPINRWMNYASVYNWIPQCNVVKALCFNFEHSVLKWWLIFGFFMNYKTWDFNIFRNLGTVSFITHHNGQQSGHDLFNKQFTFRIKAHTEESFLYFLIIVLSCR